MQGRLELLQSIPDQPIDLPEGPASGATNGEVATNGEAAREEGGAEGDQGRGDGVKSGGVASEAESMSEITLSFVAPRPSQAWDPPPPAAAAAAAAALALSPRTHSQTTISSGKLLPNPNCPTPRSPYLAGAANRTVGALAAAGS